MNPFMTLVSWVFHPMLLSTYMSVAIAFTSPELFGPVGNNNIQGLILAMFMSTFAMPTLCMVLLKSYGVITNIELVNRKERLIPFTSIILFYFIAAFMLFKVFKISDVFLSLIISVASLITLLSVITSKFKISIHGASNWGVAGALCYLSIFFDANMAVPLVLMLPIAGLVSTSRLYLGFHTPKEIWTGSVLGFSYNFFFPWVFNLVFF